MRLLLLAALAALVTGCGGVAGGDRPNEDATLVLDGPPAAVQAGIYLARSRGFDEAEGVRLRIRRRGRGDLAIVPIDALARDHLVGVMAIVQTPLEAVFSNLRPRDLDRVRGDRAVLRSVVAGDGGDPDALRFVSRRADATTGRWDLRPRDRAFRLDDHGAPSFPGLVLAASRQTIDERAPVVRAAIRALQRGYQQAQADPESGVGAIPGDRAELTAQMDAVAPAFTAGAQGVGQLRMPALREWAAWKRRYAGERPDVGALFDLSLVAPPPSAG